MTDHFMNEWNNTCDSSILQIFSSVPKRWSSWSFKQMIGEKQLKLRQQKWMGIVASYSVIRLDQNQNEYIKLRIKYGHIVRNDYFMVVTH